jgi:hypothetical protein
MLGLVETSLFLVPIVLYAVWRINAAQGGPSVRSLIAGALAVAVLAVTLFFFVRDNRIDPSAKYIPPAMQDGRLIPAQAIPK